MMLWLHAVGQSLVRITTTRRETAAVRAGIGLVEVGRQLGHSSPRRIGQPLGDLMPLEERL